MYLISKARKTEVGGHNSEHFLQDRAQLKREHFYTWTTHFIGLCFCFFVLSCFRNAPKWSMVCKSWSGELFPTYTTPCNELQITSLKCLICVKKNAMPISEKLNYVLFLEIHKLVGICTHTPKNPVIQPRLQQYK